MGDAGNLRGTETDTDTEMTFTKPLDVDALLEELTLDEKISLTAGKKSPLEAPL